MFVINEAWVSMTTGWLQQTDFGQSACIWLIYSWVWLVLFFYLFRVTNSIPIYSLRQYRFSIDPNILNYKFVLIVLMVMQEVQAGVTKA